MMSQAWTYVAQSLLVLMLLTAVGSLVGRWVRGQMTTDRRGR